MSTSLAIGFDLGGTKLAAGLVDPGGALLAHRTWPERVGDYPAAIEAIGQLGAQLREDAGAGAGEVAAVGIAAAAFLDAGRERIVHAANLGWHDCPLRADLERRLELPVAVVNDADAAAWGEYVHGAGAAHPSLVLITLGTGVGGGIVVDGQLVTGAHGLGGELGHLPLVLDGRLCPCGARGCLEQYASGTALRRIAQEGARAQPAAACRLLELAGGEIAAIDGPAIAAAAEQGDAVAIAAFDEVGRWLGLGVAHVVALLDPAVVLIGGGLAAAGELVLAPARASYAAHVGMPALHGDPPLALARLGANAGVIGAAALARADLAHPRP